MPWAGLKLRPSGTGVDEIGNGATGSPACPVDERDGRLGRPEVARLAGDGFEINVLPAVPRSPPLRTLGRDVAQTPDGPVIVDANAHRGPEESPRMAAVFDRMRAA